MRTAQPRSRPRRHRVERVAARQKRTRNWEPVSVRNRQGLETVQGHGAPRTNLPAELQYCIWDQSVPAGYCVDSVTKASLLAETLPPRRKNRIGPSAERSWRKMSSNGQWRLQALRDKHRAVVHFARLSYSCFSTDRNGNASNRQAAARPTRSTTTSAKSSVALWRLPINSRVLLVGSLRLLKTRCGVRNHHLGSGHTGR